ncbi:hypothetical protein JZM24_09095 [Candidatus Sodalis endolongispinus]|uniref:Uncharacterized protein n=1 Tax=Candidatus Sodalis endolongispinus TaxID=2812662 RepID=A0ABS5YC96_9GAMM|nr:hypothetical protein [Candidatus Sodalis endolongispinus]MBT9432239.1 hypothetical protein [Candidatus Sodalis endolongispinus]
MIRDNWKAAGQAHGSYNQWQYGKKTTNQTDDYSHIVVIGSHYHDFSGTTNKTENNTAINITNASITLMGWYRSH